MVEYPVPYWIYSVAALLLSISLIFGGSSWQYYNIKRACRRMAIYFFSLSPAAMLCYLLYEISHLQ